MDGKAASRTPASRNTLVSGFQRRQVGEEQEDRVLVYGTATGPRATADPRTAHAACTALFLWPKDAVFHTRFTRISCDCLSPPSRHVRPLASC